MSRGTPRSIEIAGVTHGVTPIPMGARVGNTLYSSGISGVDGFTGKLPLDAASQARQAFINMQSLLKAAGFSLDDVVRVTVYAKDNSVRDHLNAEWIACFPDPNDRPARHTLIYDLRHGLWLQLEIVAVLSTS